MNRIAVLLRGALIGCATLAAPALAADAPPQQVVAVPPVKPPAPVYPPPDAESAACLATLAARGVSFRRLPTLAGDEPCGTETPLEVTTLPGGVALEPAAVLNCAMAGTLADWTADVLIPAAKQHLDATPRALHVAGSYVCRTVNGSPRGNLSQHAYANAIDIASVTLQSDAIVPVSYRGHPRLQPRTARAGFQRALRQGACARFMTVIGPGGDAFHGDHFHFDLSPRKSGAKVCD